MKKLLRCLVISSFVLPILIPSTVFAFGGPVPTYGFQDRERYRSGDLNAGRAHLNADPTDVRRFAMNRDRFGGTPPNAPNGGGKAPIDGGISLLLAAGLGLGVKKVIGKNKASKQDNNDIEE